MSGKPVEIVCTACGADTLLRREPVYDGLRKTGERLSCAACGAVFADEAAVPFKRQTRASLFTEDERPKRVDLFSAEEKSRNCRRCRHFVVNPFTQRCGLHLRVVQATDCCGDFEPKAPDAAAGQG
jgi:hypothetical protein